MEFPHDVRRKIGLVLSWVQYGLKHADAKPWKGAGTGVFEIVESHQGDAYRAVYTIRFEKAVYMLHAFQKKSPSGIRTAQRDVELIAKRMKEAMKDHEAS